MGLDNGALLRAIAVAAVAALAALAIGQRSRGPLPAAAAAAAAAIAAASLLSRRSHAVWAHYPRQYVVRRGTPDAIDGDVFKSVWEAVPWSEPFVEIRGLSDAPEGTSPTVAQATRMKMLWDDEFLYIAAVMDAAAGDEIIARFTERNSPIFHTDSDFEVFVDPAGCCHGYKELELNAINTVWNLMLTKPYSDGGTELSGRVAREGDPSYWEVRQQKTATRIIRGGLHDASQASQWGAEIALAHSDTLPGAPVLGETPAVGRCWRINFSRVEKNGKVNWVWSPQVVWAPAAGTYQGQVNMHLPDAWGYAVFADADGRLADGSPASSWRDPAWPARHTAAVAYYAARLYCERRGCTPSTLQDLREANLLSRTAMEGAKVTLVPNELAEAGYTIEAVVGGWAARVTHERLLTVQPTAS